MRGNELVSRFRFDGLTHDYVRRIIQWDIKEQMEDRLRRYMHKTCKHMNLEHFQEERKHVWNN